jgi:hypothetical protein
MEHIRFFAELIGILVGAIVILFLVTVLLRSSKIPECFSCGAMKVRPSRAVGFWDVLGLAFGIRPYRCGGCRERFYGLRMFGEAKKPSAVQQRQRVVKVVFRFRYGLPNRVAIRVVDPSKEPEPIPSSSAILQI